MEEKKKARTEETNIKEAPESKSDEKQPKKERRNKNKEMIEKLNKEILEYQDKQLRNIAELENFKKRMHIERINDRKFASKNLIADILNPLDQLCKAVNMETDNKVLNNFLIGFKMINDQFYKLLEEDGLKEIDALNKKFDPKIHHAIEKLSDCKKENGINLEVIQKGYTYKDQILRPAMVKINEWSEENGKDK